MIREDKGANLVVPGASTVPPGIIWYYTTGAICLTAFPAFLKVQGKQMDLCADYPLGPSLTVGFSFINLPGDDGLVWVFRWSETEPSFWPYPLGTSLSPGAKAVEGNLLVIGRI